MWIQSITIEHCRLLASVALELSPKLNLIVGPNASGKTSLLEALYILSKGRSFRTSHINEVISTNKQSVLVAANISDPNKHNTKKSNTRIGIEKSKKKTKIRINKQDIYTQAELSAHLPITVIHPNSVDLITGSPSQRRAFLDWIAFYLYPDFLDKWKTYQHILKQRNFCLKDPQHRYGLEKWTEALIELQPTIIHYRQSVIERLQPILDETVSALLKDISVSLAFKTGFPKDVELDHDSLLAFYTSRQAYDCKINRTSAGSHRADFSILMNGTPAIESASRGQLKLLAICLLLAQSKSISSETSGEGVLLIDDLAAELDANNKTILLNYLSQLDKQLIITSTHDIEFTGAESKVFHVKHGQISPQ